MTSNNVVDIIKNTLISEIEELNSFPSNQKNKNAQDDILSICYNRESQISNDSLVKVIQSGVDPAFILPIIRVLFQPLFISCNYYHHLHNHQITSHSSLGNSKGRHQELDAFKDDNGSTATVGALWPLLEEQLEAFHYQLDTAGTEESDVLGFEVEGESELSVKDRIQRLNIPPTSFDPLFDYVKSTRPALWQALWQLPVISGITRSHKKSSKKEKKRRDRDNKLKQHVESSGGYPSENKRRKRRDVAGPSETAPPPPILDLQDMCAILVVKCIADGSVVSYLVAISFLISVSKNSHEGVSVPWSDFSIPVAGILGALFAPPDATEESGGPDDTGRVGGLKAGGSGAAESSITFSTSAPSGGKSRLQLNPFLQYVSRYNNMEDSVSVPLTISMVEEEERLAQLTASRDTSDRADIDIPRGQHGQGPWSDAGSTAGSTRAEQGTETASAWGDGDLGAEVEAEEMDVEGDPSGGGGPGLMRLAEVADENEDDANEEEMLAQALALSMTASPSASTAPSALGEGLRPLEVFSSLQGGFSGGSASICSTEDSEKLQRASSRQGSNSCPSEFLKVLPLSTNGPFSRPEFWEQIPLPPPVPQFSSSSNEADMNIDGRADAVKDSGAMIPTRLVIISLITALARSADDVLGVDPLPMRCFETDSFHLLFSLDGDEKNFASSTASNGSPMFEFEPSAVSLQLLEIVLDQLIVEVSDLNKLASAREEEEFEFHRYLLVWSISMILKILRAHLQVMITGRMYMASLGFGVQDNNNISTFVSDIPQFRLGDTSAGSIWPRQMVDTYINKSAVDPRLSFRSRLLMLVADCIGLEFDMLAENKGVVSSAISKDLKLHNDLSDAHLSCHFLRHELRMAGIDTFVAGFTAFSVSVMDRRSFLMSLMDNCPRPTDPGLQTDLTLLCDISSRYGSSELSAYSASFVLNPQVYLYLLLQRLGRLSLTYFMDAQASQRIVDSISNPLQFERDKARSFAVSNISALESIERALISRLSDESIMAYKAPLVFASLYPELPCVPFTGEFCLLRAIHKYRVQLFIDQGNDVISSMRSLTFNPERCHKSVALSPNRTSATFRAWNKTWASLSAGTEGFQPGSGVHEWEVRIDMCERGHIFVGVVTAEASMDTYVGGDKFGWGAIGTKSLWHKRAKVSSDFGVGFGTGSNLYLRLNSDTGSLWICSAESEWVSAFENLPSVPLFPAFSLHHRDDQISLNLSSGPQCIDIADTTQSNMSSPVLSSPMWLLRFVNYAQAIFAAVEGILVAADACLDVEPIRAHTISSHPFIGVLVPSLAAAVLSTKFLSARLASITSFRLIPYLTIIAKRLSKLKDDFESRKLSAPETGLAGPIGATEWLFKSSTDEYRIWFQDSQMNASLAVPPKSENDTNTPEPGIESLSEIPALRGVTRVGGKGRRSGSGPASFVTVSGTQFGTRITLLEMWSGASSCIIDGRLSLCGCFIVGSYKEAPRSNKALTVGASRIARRAIVIPHTYEGLKQAAKSPSIPFCIDVLKKTGVLCSLVCGKLAGTLIIGVDDAYVRSGATSFDRSNFPADIEMSNSNTEEPEDREELAGPSDDYLKGVGSLPDEDDSDYKLGLEWAENDLFSGGLPLDSSHLRRLRRHVSVISRFEDTVSASVQATMIDSDDAFPALIDDESALPPGGLSAALLLNWWLSKTFPILYAPPSSNAEASNGWQSRYKFLLEDFPSGRSFEGNRLDERVSQHLGNQSFAKLGGEHMAATRRLVLAAIIKHSGCGVLCLALLQQLVSAGRATDSDSGKPLSLVKDVWRTAQRVMEDVVRQKQTSGLSLAALCSSLTLKANLLLRVEQSSTCVRLESVLSFLHGDELEDKISIGIQQVSGKLLRAILNFFLCPIRDTGLVESVLLQRSFRAVVRIAGLRSISFLFSRQDDTPQGIVALPALSSLSFQVSAIEYLLPAFLGRLNASAPQSTSPVEEGDLSIGHYTSGLRGANSDVHRQLTSSFETLYEFITQLLARSTWAGDREGQIVALACWGVKVSTNDHLFLNRVGIFRVLQTILDDTRTSLSDLEKANQKNSLSNAALNSSLNDPSSTFAFEIVESVTKSLAQLVLQIVHGLASQVAFATDSLDADEFDLDSYTQGHMSSGSALSLKRMPSGPDTLSQSLFDMFFSELFFGFKDLFVRSDKELGGGSAHGTEDSRDSTATLAVLSAQAKPPFDSTPLKNKESLKGEEYIYNVLKLLSSVSVSKVCQRSLSTSKWFSLLLLGVGYGGLNLQRRLMRLLGVLLLSINPSNFNAYVPKLLGDREELQHTDSPFDEDDIKDWIALSASDGSSASERLVDFLVDAVSLNLFPVDLSTGEKSPYIFRAVNSHHTTETLASESLSVLRSLQSEPDWCAVIEKVIVKEISGTSEVAAENDLRRFIASAGIIGGYVDRIRLGGLAYLKPFALAAVSDPLANKLTGLSRNCGMIVVQTSTVVELVLIDEASVKQRNRTANAETRKNKKTTTNKIHNPVPLIAVRTNISDVVAVPDIAADACNISCHLFAELLESVKRVALPQAADWARLSRRAGAEGSSTANEMDEGESGSDVAEGRDSPASLVDAAAASPKPTGGEAVTEQQALHSTLVTSIFRALSKCLQSDDLVRQLLSDGNTSFLMALFDLATADSSSGGLCVIEAIEERWVRLWDTYCAPSSLPPGGLSSDSDAVTAGRKKPDDVSDQSQYRRSSVGQSLIDAAVAAVAGGRQSRRPEPNSRASPLLEAAAAVGLLGPFGTAFSRAPPIDSAQQATALAQMTDMGLPREWCEVALRRCRYNVEMAINMCFENGADMAHIVAEEAMIRESQASREREDTRGGGHASSAARSGAPQSSSHIRSQDLANLILRSSTALGASRRSSATVGPEDSNSRTRYLIDMGFPRSWCVRALEATNDNVDAALGWIISHGEELLVEDDADSSSDAGGSSEPTRHAEHARSNNSSIQNPLTVVSGSCDLSDDLFCSATQSGFPSVGCRGFSASTGRWYFEVTLGTAGCIQVGWVDNAFMGNAEAGQGVGDDVHSWAFDGWRMYLWHEFSAEWGSRWAPGDVVGCAVDLDNREMSFFLNGFGAEIDMGIAFRDFDFSGGIYPALSFNRKENAFFNLGSTSFRFSPPPGYRGFQLHIEECIKMSTQHMIGANDAIFINSCLSSSPANTKGIILAASSVAASGQAGAALLLEDAFEEGLDDHALPASKRYFGSVDEISARPTTASLLLPGQGKQAGLDRGGSVSAPSPVFNTKSVQKCSKNELLTQLLSISKDLVTLYARTSLLILLRSLPRLAEKELSFFVNSVLLVQWKGPPDTVAPEETGTYFSRLLLLLRLAGMSTSRTKIYLQAVSVLPPHIAAPPNLGSLLSVGGAPLLYELRDSLVVILKHIVTRSAARNEYDLSNAIMNCMIDHVFVDTVNVTRRSGNSSDWFLDAGLAPVSRPARETEALQNFKNGFIQQSLSYAVWLTTVLLDELCASLHLRADGKGWAAIGTLLPRLCRSWSLALRSSVEQVKLSAMRVLSIILQEIDRGNVPSCRLSNAPRDMVADVIAASCAFASPYSIDVAISRLTTSCLKGLTIERGCLPAVSEYLQVQLELAMTLRNLQVAGLTSTDRINSLIDEDTGAEGEDWESVSGRLLCDGGLETWTGFVRQLAMESTRHSFEKTSSQQPQERQLEPPELMPGCRVSRMVKRRCIESIAASDAPDLVPSSSELKVEDTTDEISNSNIRSDNLCVIDKEDDLSSSPRQKKPRSDSPTSPSSDSNLEDNASASRSVMIEQFGTVVGITDWEGCSIPGSARLIRWDNDDNEEERTTASQIDEQRAPELVRWGADGAYDVTHLRIKNGKVLGKYPSPLIRNARNEGVLDTDQTFGVILRVRRLTSPSNFSDTKCVEDVEDHDPHARLVGILEWPDFGATVLVTGECDRENMWTLTERKLISGVKHALWSPRFGHTHWRAGSTYLLSHSSDPDIDTTDPYAGALLGQGLSTATINGRNVGIVSDVHLQKSNLFLFDENAMARTVVLSSDKRTVAKSGGSGQSVAFASVGFSSGVHYWEFKIEQAEIGSIFLGVAEKPFPAGLSASIFASRCNRWIGSGLCNHRASFRSGSSGQSDRVSSYGDHFHSGDVVGVLLDMNRGRLSFFLDGIKYGEHTIADLGEAFDSLSTPTKVKPRTLYPVVGMQRSQDRITITPRWLSTTGVTSESELSLISNMWRMITHWAAERTTLLPLAGDAWLYRAAWRDWLQWKAGQSVRVKSRSKVTMCLNISPTACVEASIRLGLPKALFRGDRLLFSKSSGRQLEAKEEAVILGAYKGQIWYRLDNHQIGDGLTESGVTAWSLAPNDIDGLVLLRRGATIESGIPLSVQEIDLARIPPYHGGLVILSHEGGAVMRNGLEIDTSDVICSIPNHAIVFAIERRINASNIARYKVVYDGKVGWISERMRGGSEDVMLSRLSARSSTHQIDTARRAAEEIVATLGLPDRLLWDDVASLEVAMSRWTEAVSLRGAQDILKRNIDIVGDTLESYVSIASTVDGQRPWSIEADMQLVDMMSKVALREGVIPYNLPVTTLRKAVETLSSDILAHNSDLLIPVDTDRIIARGSLLRVANLIFGYTLPYFNLCLPEEKLRRDYAGADDDIESVNTAAVGTGGTITGWNRAVSAATTQTAVGTTRSRKIHWSPPCAARKIRNLRRLFFNQTKIGFWEAVLEATTTPTSLHQDEYEDPREIRSLRINRVKATHARLASITNLQDRFKQTVFGQLHKEMRGWPNSSFRRSYLGKGHGGQRRAFKVKFVGEGVNDYGGPYRAVFEHVVDELQADSVTIGRRPAERCLLPLVIPCANRSAALGANQDKFVFNPVASSPSSQEHMNFFGKIVGTAVRHNLTLGLDLSALVWRPLVKLPLTLGHLETVDTLSSKSIASIVSLGLQLEAQAQEQHSAMDTDDDGSCAGSRVPEEWADLVFAVHLSDGSRLPLIPGGEDIPVTLDNWRDYADLALRCRLKESSVVLKAFRDGLASVVPVEILPIFSAQELELLVTGTRHVDVAILRQCAEYENVSPDSAVVKFFWEVLDEMSEEDKTLFLRFVWARSRMPSSVESLTTSFKLQGPQGEAKSRPDDYLPHAQTCFFSLSLPEYSTKDVLRQKLLYAIKNSPNMDADVRMHTAEGWAD